MKRSKLNPISDARRKSLYEYKKLRLEHLKSFPVCEVCKSRSSNQIHHKKGQGIYRNVVEYFLAVCFKCHRRIEDEKEWAFQQGYRVDRIGL